MEYADCIIFQANSILSSDSCEVSRRKKEMVLWKNVTVSYNSNAHSMLCLMRGQPILTYVRHHFSTMSISKFSEEKWFPQDCLNHEIFGSFGLTKSTWIIVYGRGLRALKNIWDWQEPRPAVSPSSIVAYLRFFILLAVWHGSGGGDTYKESYCVSFRLQRKGFFINFLL